MELAPRGYWRGVVFGRHMSSDKTTTLNPTFDAMEVEQGHKAAQKNPFNRQRKTKDLACLAVFYAFLLSVFVLCGVAYSKGNPHILFFGLDYRGRVCGENALSGFDARYWVSYSTSTEVNLLFQQGREEGGLEGRRVRFRSGLGTR